MYGETRFHRTSPIYSDTGCPEVLVRPGGAGATRWAVPDHGASPQRTPQTRLDAGGGSRDASPPTHPSLDGRWLAVISLSLLYHPSPRFPCHWTESKQRELPAEPGAGVGSRAGADPGAQPTSPPCPAMRSGTHPDHRPGMERDPANARLTPLH